MFRNPLLRKLQGDGMSQRSPNFHPENNSFVFLLWACLFSLFLVGCSSSSQVQTHEYSGDSAGRLASSPSQKEISEEWSIKQLEELEVLTKNFPKADNEQIVFSLGIQSCRGGFTEGEEQSLLRQLFIGFDNVEVIRFSEPEWLRPGLSLAHVKASLEDHPFAAIIFSEIREGCLIEQAFWCEGNGRWLHGEEMEKTLFSELRVIPPWNKREWNKREWNKSERWEAIEKESTREAENKTLS